MSMAETLRDFLRGRGVEFNLLDHPAAASSSEAAEAAHVPGDRLAKPVVVEDAERYLAIVIPATRRLDFTALHERLGRQIGLATDREVERLFADCEPGAMPAVPQAYGLDALVDDALLGLDEVYFEAGDRSTLVRVAGTDFRALMGAFAHGRFTEPMDRYGEGRKASS